MGSELKMCELPSLPWFFLLVAIWEERGRRKPSLFSCRRSHLSHLYLGQIVSSNGNLTQGMIFNRWIWCREGSQLGKHISIENFYTLQNWKVNTTLNGRAKLTYKGSYFTWNGTYLISNVNSIYLFGRRTQTYNLIAKRIILTNSTDSYNFLIRLLSYIGIVYNITLLKKV